MPRGRKTKLTDEKQQAIVDNLRDGCFFSVACRLAGVLPDTARDWLRKGENKDSDSPYSSEYTQFSLRVREAEAYTEQKAIAGVLKVGYGRSQKKTRTVIKTVKNRTDKDGNPLPDFQEETVETTEYFEQDWRALEFFLKQRFPDRWGAERLDVIAAAKTLAEEGLLDSDVASGMQDCLDDIREVARGRSRDKPDLQLLQIDDDTE